MWGNGNVVKYHNPRELSFACRNVRFYIWRCRSSYQSKSEKTEKELWLEISIGKCHQNRWYCSEGKTERSEQKGRQNEHKIFQIDMYSCGHYEQWQLCVDVQQNQWHPIHTLPNEAHWWGNGCGK